MGHVVGEMWGEQEEGGEWDLGLVYKMRKEMSVKHTFILHYSESNRCYSPWLVISLRIIHLYCSFSV